MLNTLVSDILGSRVRQSFKILLSLGLVLFLAGFSSLHALMYFPTPEFEQEFSGTMTKKEAILVLPKLAGTYTDYGYKWVGDYHHCEVNDWKSFTRFDEAKGLKFSAIEQHRDGKTTYRITLTDRRRAGQRLCIGLTGPQGGVTAFTDPIRRGLRLAEGEIADNTENTAETATADTSDEESATDPEEEGEVSLETETPTDLITDTTSHNGTSDDTVTTGTNIDSEVVTGTLVDDGAVVNDSATLSGDVIIVPATGDIIAPTTADTTITTDHTEQPELAVRSGGDNLDGNMTLDIYMVTGANNDRREPATALVEEKINSYLHIAPSGKDFVMYDAKVRVTFPKKYVGYNKKWNSNAVDTPQFAKPEIAATFNITEDTDNWYFEYLISELKGGITTTIPFAFAMKGFVTPKDWKTNIKVDILDKNNIIKYTKDHTYTSKIVIPNFQFQIRYLGRSFFHYTTDRLSFIQDYDDKLTPLFRNTYTDATQLTGVWLDYKKFELPIHYYGSGNIPTHTDDQYKVGYQLTLDSYGYGSYIPENTLISVKLPNGAIFKPDAQNSFGVKWEYDSLSHSVIAKLAPNNTNTIFDTSYFSQIFLVLHYPNQPIDNRQEPIASVILAKDTLDEVDLGTQTVATRWKMVPTKITHTGKILKTARHLWEDRLFLEHPYQEGRVLYNPSINPVDYGSKSSFMLLAYHKSSNKDISNAGMKLTKIVDYDLDPNLYYGKIKFFGFRQAGVYFSDPIWWEIPDDKLFSIGVYGIKHDGSKHLLGNIEKTNLEISIMDKNREYNRLEIEFTDPFILKDESVAFTIDTYVLDSIWEQWKTSLTGESDPLYNSISGYYTLPNDDIEIISSTAAIKYIQPTLKLDHGDHQPRNISVIYSGDQTISLKIPSLHDSGLFANESTLSGFVGKVLVLLPHGIEPKNICTSPWNDKILGTTNIYNYKNTNKTAHIISYQRGPSKDGFQIYCDYLVTKDTQIGNNSIEYYHYWENLPYPNINPYPYYGRNFVDIYDFDDDGEKTELFLQGPNTILNYNAAREIILKNSVADSTSSTGVYLSMSPVENKSQFYYKMNILNNSLTEASNLTIYNVLPALGDHAIVADKDGGYPARGSAFPVQLVRSLESVPENASLLTQWDIYYSTDVQPQTTAQMADVSWKRADQITDFSAVKMIKIVQKPDTTLGTNAQANFYLHSRIPDGLNQPDMSTAVGSSAFSTNGTQFYEGNKVTVQLVNHYKVSGTIFQDMSGSGSLDNAIPLSGYRVYLYSGDNPVPAVGGGFIETISNADGYYEMTIPHKGTYTVRVAARYPARETVLYTSEYGVYVPGIGNDAKHSHSFPGLATTPFTVDGYNVSNPARPFDQPTSMAAIRNIGIINVEPFISILKVDEKTRLPLSGAIFNISHQPGLCVGPSEANIRYPRGMAPVRFPWEGVTYHTTNADGFILFKQEDAHDGLHFASLCQHTYTIKEIKAPDGYELDPTPIVLSWTGIHSTGIVVTNKKLPPLTGEIHILKSDSKTNKMLSGVQFSLYKSPVLPTDVEEFVALITTSSTGFASITVPEGEYRLVETKPLRGYRLNTQNYYVSVGAKSISLLPIQNDQLTKLVDVCFVDGEDYTPIQTGYVSFELGHHQNLSTEHRGSSSEHCLRSSIEMPYGTYTFTGTVLPDGYTLPEENTDRGIVYLYTGILVDDETNRITIPLTPTYHPLVLRKLDGKTMAPLRGAVFEVYKIVDQQHELLVDTITTDEQGEGRSNQLLKLGTYKLKEITAPNGYKLNSDPITVHLPMRDASEITVTNEKEDAKKKSIQFCIVDEETREVMNVSLPFNLTGVVDEMNPIWMDNCTSFNVLYGEFDLTTTNKPVDYTFGSNFTGGHMTVTIDDTVERIDILYKPLRDVIQIHKVDLARPDVLLAGATFEVLHPTTREVLDTITTSETGFAVSKPLKYGQYILKETVAPDGYRLPRGYYQDPIERTITLPQTTGYTFTNRPIGKSIKVCIRDAFTKELIYSSPATFQFPYSLEYRDDLQFGQYSAITCTIYDNIPYGTWTLTGIRPPQGYTGTPLITGIVIDQNRPDPLPIISNPISTNPTFPTVDLPNTISFDPSEPGIIILDYQPLGIGTVEINKFDLATGTPLSGVKFTIGREATWHTSCMRSRSSNGACQLEKKYPVIHTGITSHTGYLSWQLPVGNYKITEIMPLSGYVIDYNNYTVIVGSGGVYTLDIPNRKTSNDLKICTIDAETTHIITGTTIVEWMYNQLGLAPVTPVFPTPTLPPTDFMPPLDEEANVVVGRPIVGLSRSAANMEANLLTAVRNAVELGTFSHRGALPTQDGCIIAPNVPYNTPTVIGAEPPYGYTGSVLTGVTVPDGFTGTVYLPFTPIRKPFEIIKFDAANFATKLAGAIFQLLSVDGEILDTVTTSSTGYAITKPVRYGTYKLKEITAPTGYDLDDTERTITIPADREYISNVKTPVVTPPPVPTRDLIICVIDSETKQPILTPVAFDFAHHHGLTTVNGCVIAPNIPDGTPTLVGNTPPTGYTGTVLTGITVNNNTPPTITIPRDPIRSPLEIIKFDEMDMMSRLSGAVFQLLSEDGRILDTVTTSSTGYAITKPLRHGTYKLKEIKAPAGYSLDPTEHEIQIPNEIEYFSNARLTKTIEVCIVDRETDEVITGRTLGFTFRDQNYQHDRRCKIISDVPYGTGDFVVDGLNDNTFIYRPGSLTGVTIDENTTSIRIPLDKMLGIVSIIKHDKDEQGKLLSGAVFNLIDKHGNIVDTLTTNASGTAHSKVVPLGKYVLKETVAPVGYMTDGVSHPVDLYVQSVYVRSAMTSDRIVDRNVLLSIPNAKAQKDIEVCLIDRDSNEVITHSNVPLSFIFSGQTYPHNACTTIPNVPFGTGDFIVPLITGSIYTGTSLTGVVIDSTTTTVRIPLDRLTGRIQIHKYEGDDENKVLSGAVFEVIYSHNQELVDTITTSETGFAITKPLKMGVYSVREVTPPTGYKLNTNVYVPTVYLFPSVGGTELSAEIWKLSVSNVRATQDIELCVVDRQTNQVVTGRAFDMTFRDQRYTHDRRCQIVSVPYGTGDFVALPPTDPYSVYTGGSLTGITIDATTTGIRIPVDSFPHWISIWKYDADTNTGLSGAVFEITDDQDKLIDTVTSNRDGSVLIPKTFRPGTYKIREIQAPAGYQLTSDVITLTLPQFYNCTDNPSGVCRGAASYYLSVPNKKLTKDIEVCIVDRETDEVITTNVIPFTFRDQEYTHPSACITIPNVPYGTGDFIVPKPDWTMIYTGGALTGVTIDDMTTTIRIPLDKVGSPIEIIKFDQDDQYHRLSGAVFELRDEYDRPIETLTTSETGFVISQWLKYGRYKLVEITAPAGYDLNPIEHIIDVPQRMCNDGPSGTIGCRPEPHYIANKRTTKTVTICLIDNETKQPILTPVTLDFANRMGLNTVNGCITIPDVPTGTPTLTGNVPPYGYTGTIVTGIVITGSTPPTITIPLDPIRIPVVIHKVDAADQTRLAGAVFQLLSEDGQVIDTLTTSSTGYAISTPVRYGTYKLKEITAPAGYDLNTTERTIQVPSTDHTFTNTKTPVVTPPTPTPTHTVTICLIDSQTNQPILTPVTLDFANRMGLTTVNGCISIPDVPTGTPTLTGNVPPYGYTGTILTGIVITGSTPPTITIPLDPILVPFSFKKLDAINTDKGLAGAIFELTDANGHLVERLTSSATGYVVTSPLRYGTYKLREITAPAGYALDATEHTITIPTSPINISTIVNHPLTGSVIFTKVDQRDQTKKLSGAIFAIQTMTGHELMRVTTDDNGFAAVSGLVYGTYKVVEVQAPRGYRIGSGFEITIDRTIQPHTFIVPNDKLQGTIKIIKVDQEDQTKKLAGAIFQLRDRITNALIETLTTNASGFALSSSLPYGEYAITEIQAPTGYDKNFTGAVIELADTEVAITVANLLKKVVTPPPVSTTPTTPSVPGSPTGYTIPTTGTVTPPNTGTILPPSTGTVLPPLDIPTKPDKTHDAAPDQPTPPKKPTPIKTYVPKLPKTGALDEEEIRAKVGVIAHRRINEVEIDLPINNLWTGHDRLYQTNLQSWLPFLDPKEYGQTAYLVLPVQGLIIPIQSVAPDSPAYDNFIHGKEESFNSYLASGAVLLPGTSTASYGYKGNKVIAGHSSFWKDQIGDYKTHFQHIIALEPDEEIWIYKRLINGNYRRYVYRVDQSYETKANDVSILYPSEQDIVTLFTCTPIGGTSGRWVVKSHLIKTDVSMMTDSSSKTRNTSSLRSSKKLGFIQSFFVR